MAEDLELPRDAIITLVVNQNKSYYLESNYYREVAYLLAEYKSKFGDYNNIYNNDYELWKKLNYVKILLENTDLMNEDIIKFLTNKKDIDIQKSTKRKDYNINEIIIRLKEKASSQNGVLTRKDISSSDIYYLNQEAYRQDTYLFELLNMYDIEYKGGRPRNRASLMKVKYFPYIDEMRKERDELYEQFKAKNLNVSKEYKFDAYLDICIQVYRKYEDKITKQSEADFGSSNGSYASHGVKNKFN